MLLAAGGFRSGDLDPVGRDRQRQAGRLVGEGILADLDLVHLGARDRACDSKGSVVTKSPLTETERSAGFLPVSRMSTASLIASDER